jgi:hypothetical protein
LKKFSINKKDDDSKSKILFGDYIDESQGQTKQNSEIEFSTFNDAMKNINEQDDFEEEEVENGPTEINPNSETQFNYDVDDSSIVANTANGKLVNIAEDEATNEQIHLAPVLVNSEDDDDDDEDEDSDDENGTVNVVIDLQSNKLSNSAASTLNRQKSNTKQATGTAVAGTTSTTQPLTTQNSTTQATLGNTNVAGQLNTVKLAPQQPVKGVDVEAPGTINDVPTFDYDLADVKDEDKPWRKPGADITDYFNYGFSEESWILYCMKQKRLRAENSNFKVSSNS